MLKAFLFGALLLTGMVACEVAQAQYPYGRTDYYPFGRTSFYAPAPTVVASPVVAPVVPVAATAVVVRKPVLRPFARPTYFSVGAAAVPVVPTAPVSTYYRGAVAAPPVSAYYAPAAVPVYRYYPPVTAGYRGW